MIAALDSGNTHMSSHAAPYATLGVDPISIAHYYELVSGDPGQPEDGLRFQPVFPGATGYRELVRIMPGFELLVGDIQFEESTVIELRESASLKFHFRLAGDHSIGLNSRELYHVGHHTVGVLLHPDNVMKQEVVKAGEHERSVTLICNAEFLRRELDYLTDVLPETLEHFVRDGLADTFSQTVPLRAGMAVAALELLNAAPSPVRRLMLKARASELLALTLEALIEEASGHAREEPILNSRDMHCLNQARDRLERDFVTPPTITALARSVGLNEAKLMHAFKRVFGCTIFDYTQALRMRQARQLLETTDLSITEIAFDVGYEYSSNFATAFKRHFGITPSAARDALKMN